MTSICILGSTGSVGVQSLEVARSLGLKVSGLSAYSEVELLAEQARQFGPDMVGIGDVRAEARARALFSRMSTPPELFFGPEGVSQVAAAAEHDLVVNAIVGFAGVWPTLAAIDAGHDVALANKETLVAAGSVVMDRARQEGVAIRPIDSEHSAIYQCIQGQGREAVARIILTASGGPFIDRYDFADISVAEAISHPNWNMGPKISVDSATMINKALEVVEARWLFDVDSEMIDIVVHRESVIHSMVEYCDGSIIAQLGTADMRTPIQYALTCPERVEGLAAKLDLSSIGKLTFEKPDLSRFPGAGLGHEALRHKGVVPAVMSAANEEAVRLFLHGDVRFVDIVDLVMEAMESSPRIEEPSLDDIVEADVWAREFVRGRCRSCTR